MSKRLAAIGACLTLAGAIALAPAPARATTESELADAAARLEELGSQLASVQGQLASATLEAQELDAAVDSKGEEVAASREELGALRDSLASTLSLHYKQGPSTLLDYLLGSSSFDDLVGRIYYADKISGRLTELVAAVESTTERLSREQVELEASLSAQQARVDELMALVEEYQGYVDGAASVYDALDEQARAELAERAKESEAIAAAVDAAEGASADRETALEEDAESGVEPPVDTGDPQDPETPGTPSTPGGSSSGGDPSLDPTVSRTRDTYLANVTWGGDADYIDALAARAGEIGSSTSYFVTFDNELCRVIVYQRQGGTWTAVKLYNCNGAKNTYSGVWKVAHKQICNWDDSYFGRGYNDWSTCYIEAYHSSNTTGHSRYVPGRGWEDCAAIHSTGYTTTGWSNRGCAGLQWADAKWVYDNIPVGTTVYEFRYSSLL